MIISASRRTDIPAFYAEWFIKRIRAGHVLTRNPFNARQIRRVSLAAPDVDAIIFWTRNPEPLFPYLAELDEIGYRYYFQYTLTGYPRLLEHGAPRLDRAITLFSRLSERLGPQRVIWRYDPILISAVTKVEEHKRLFEEIAMRLQGKTLRVIISFTDFYAGVRKNLSVIKDLQMSDDGQDFELFAGLVTFMADIAHKYGMEIQSCAETVDLSPFGVSNGKCIDDALIKRIYGVQLAQRKDKGQRKACACIASVDIGQYNTCLHGCLYCYATSNPALAAKNFVKHDPDGAFLYTNSAR